MFSFSYSLLRDHQGYEWVVAVYGVDHHVFNTMSGSRTDCINFCYHYLAIIGWGRTLLICLLSAFLLCRFAIFYVLALFPAHHRELLNIALLTAGRYRSRNIRRSARNLEQRFNIFSPTYGLGAGPLKYPHLFLTINM